MMTVIFDPVAQNTIVRPMAQAVCLAQGGKPVEYVDTSDQKKKVINESRKCEKIKIEKKGLYSKFRKGISFFEN